MKEFLLQVWIKFPKRIRNITSPYLKSTYCFFSFIFSPKIKSSKDKHPVLSYCKVLESKNDDILSGGLVKISTLSKVYKENYQNSNILYLVSSAAPHCSHRYILRSKSLGISTIWNQNGVGFPAWAGDNYKRINKKMRECYSASDFVIFQSNFCKQSANKFLGQCKSSEVIYNSINTAQFTPNKSLKRDCCRLIIAGSHMFSYRIFAALKCVEKLKRKNFSVNLTIAGKITWKNGFEEVQNKIKELGIVDLVKFSPPYTRLDAPDLYKKNHILLHTQYNDASPTVPLEAMACGLPVVGSSSGGMAEIVSSDAGILLDAKKSFEVIDVMNEEYMAQAVMSIWEKYESFSLAARTHAEENFDDSIWLEKHRIIFEKLLSKAI